MLKRRRITFVPVDHMDQVLEAVLERLPQRRPSQAVPARGAPPPPPLAVKSR